MKPRLLILNRSYWPDAEATGQLLTELAEDLTQRFDVTVLVGQPNSNPEGAEYRASGSEVRGGVRIVRVRHTRLPKSGLAGRLLNYVSFLVAAAARSMFLPRPDLVMVATDPFLLAFLGVLLRIRYRCRLVVHAQDIHPDVGIAIGKLREGLLTRAVRAALVACYRRAGLVIVPSEDMRDALISRGVPVGTVVTLPNWADAAQVVPRQGTSRFRDREAWGDQFVVMHSGNMGLTQRLETLLEVAGRLRDRKDIVFALVGGGAAEAGLRRIAERDRLDNVRFLPYQPKSELAESLGAADLHVVSVDREAIRFLMPSKLYGILAVGVPVLAVCPEWSGLHKEVTGERIGLTAEPGDAAGIATAIVEAAGRRDELAECGRRARRLAERSYDRRIVTARFAEALASVLPRGRLTGNVRDPNRPAAAA